jgi:transposase-like protein
MPLSSVQCATAARRRSVAISLDSFTRFESTSNERMKKPIKDVIRYIFVTVASLRKSRKLWRCDERLQFVARRLADEAMAELCREFGISRKTGYKIFERYQECGIQGLSDRSRRLHHYAHKLPFQVENYILNVKREHTGIQTLRYCARHRISNNLLCA